MEYPIAQPFPAIQFNPSEHPADRTLAASVLAAVVYADLFDFPLTLEEIARYQVGSSFGKEAIAHALATDPYLREHLLYRDGYFALHCRPELAAIRVERGVASRRLWPKARRYARWVSRLPYVRMVAVTGALSVHNVGELPDIDLLVVARPGRVWLCRRGLIGLVRIARMLGDDLCPNYIIAETDLELDQRDFYTAHELTQMWPLHGVGIYNKMLKANAWAARYLPAAMRVDGAAGRDRTTPLRPAIEAALGSRVFDRWERWELRRLRRKLRPLIGEAAEVVCSPTQCKGHTGLHRQNVLVRYRQRLQELGLDGDLPEVLRADPAFAV
jgi:hypothetical protein